MNHTKNYNLPQWELNDLIRMEDFNSAMSNIENGIDGVKAAAEARDTELERKVNAADVKASAKPYVTGHYTGDGTVRTITLGFRPSFVIVSGQQAVGDDSNYAPFARTIGFTGGNVITERIEITDNGFTVYPLDFEHLFFPMLNQPDWPYDYIAFK